MAIAFKTKLKSLRFVDELRKRQASFRGQRVGALLAAPDDLKWWYWLEFGAAGKQFGPVDAPYLFFPPSRGAAYPGDFVEAKKVNWPGIHPQMNVSSALSEIRQIAAEDVIVAMLLRGFRIDVVKDVLLKGTMPAAVEAIARNLEVNSPGTRTDPGGNLDGHSAAEVFREETEILDTTEDGFKEFVGSIGGLRKREKSVARAKRDALLALLTRDKRDQRFKKALSHYYTVRYHTR